MLKIKFLKDRGYGYGYFVNDGKIVRGFTCLGLRDVDDPLSVISINGKAFAVYKGRAYVFIFPQKTRFLTLEILAHEFGHCIIYFFFRRSWAAGVFNRWHERLYHFYLKYLDA